MSRKECVLFPLLRSVNINNSVSMEYFRGQQLEDTISSLQKFNALLLEKDNADPPSLSECCSVNPQMQLDLYCKQCGVDVCRECTTTTHIRATVTHAYGASSDRIHEETRRLGEVTGNVEELLEEMKQAISGVKDMKQRVRKRKDNNINMTREVFATLRKAIDEREEQTIGDIKEAAYKREKALELQLEELVLLWTQLKNCLEVMKKTNEGKMRAEELTKRRMILEQRSDYLKEMKKRSRLEPVMSEQVEPEFENIEPLCRAINRLQLIEVKPSKCEVVIPPVIVKKKTTLMIVLKNKNNNPVTNSIEELNVFIENIRDGKAIQVRAIEEVGDGRYEASFTATRCGYYMISIIVDGHHIPGSPYRTPVDRNYNKMTEQDCSQVVTHYGGNKFSGLIDVTVAPSDEVLIVDKRNRRVVVLDNKLNLLKMIGQGSGNSRLASPNGVAVTDNIIAVSDEGSHQVKKYSLQGELLSVIGCHGNKNGQFNYPRGLAFNNNKSLYVIDKDNYRVQVFRQDDTFSFSFGNRGSNPGQFQCPVRIAIDPNNNNVLVTDYSANCINLLTQDGQFIQKISSYKLRSIAISQTGYLITGHDGDDNKIKVWSPTYQLINQFGEKGSKQGEFYSINGVSIDSSGTIYVAEWDKERLQVISNN